MAYKMREGSQAAGLALKEVMKSMDNLKESVNAMMEKTVIEQWAEILPSYFVQTQEK